MENKTKINCSESSFSDEDRKKIDKGEMSFFDAMQKVMKEEIKRLFPVTTETTIQPFEVVDANSLRTGIKEDYIKKANDLMKVNILKTSCEVLIWEKHESVIPSLMDYWQGKKLVVKRYKGLFITQNMDDKKVINCVKIKLSWK